MDEVKRVWEATSLLGYPYAPFVRLLLLTGQRRTEVASMRWSDVDLDAGRWILKAGDTKSDRAHLVPLAGPAVDQLKGLPRFGEFVFSTDGETHIKGYAKGKARLDAFLTAAGDPLPPWTLHDVRRTVATHMVRLGVPMEIVARVLNHARAPTVDGEAGDGCRSSLGGTHEVPIRMARHRARALLGIEARSLSGQCGRGGAVAKLFLSYAREDSEAARQLSECIGRAGHEIWWDRHIQGGSRFASEIDRELKSADAVIVIWSESSVDSAWVQDEAAEGRDSGRLVPVTLGRSRPPLGFRQFHSIDLGSWNGDGEPENLETLIGAIEKVANERLAAKGGHSASAAPQHRGPSVCVLPFVNMSGDPEQEYFSDGITEDIITDLSKVSALLVIARNTAFAFKGQVVDVKEVARTLNVTHVLEGSVRKVGNRVRITAQLIDPETGGHLWADRYDRDLTDIFAIQDEISKAIVAALRVKLLPQEKKAIETRGTSNVDAYNLYLLARQQWVSGTGDIRRDETVVRICKRAVVLDPEYAQAWALMSLAQSRLRFWHGRDADPEPAADRALEINPDLAEAHCVKAQLLEEQGEASEATKEMDAAARLNPDSWEVNRESARLLFRQGRIRESIPFFEKAAALVESDWHNASMLITCYGATGEPEQTIRCARMTLERIEKAMANDPANPGLLATGASSLAVLGESPRAREWLERALLLLDPDNFIMRYNLACAFAADLHDPDRAIEVLEPYFENTLSATHIRHADADPDLDTLRDDPRFKDMVDAAKKRLEMAE